MKTNTTLLTPKLYFSYSQFMVYDLAEQLPGCDWTEKHTAQGFARRASTVCFGTRLEYGHSFVTIHIGSFQALKDYSRAICVPFKNISGKVTVEGPDEFDVDRAFELPPGDYMLTAAQKILSADELNIDLYFELVTHPGSRSSILVADEMLDTTEPLMESSEIAG